MNSPAMAQFASSSVQGGMAARRSSVSVASGVSLSQSPRTVQLLSFRGNVAVIKGFRVSCYRALSGRHEPATAVTSFVRAVLANDAPVAPDDTAEVHT